MTSLDDITAGLQAWIQDIRSEQTTDLNRRTYLFSPERERLFRWDVYDALEQQQQAAGLPRLAWQDTMTSFRESEAEHRKSEYSLMNDSYLPECPLWTQLARRRPGGYSNSDIRRRFRPWACMLDDWADFRHLMRENAAFCASLSRIQRYSFDLLQAWWNASYFDDKFLKMTVDHLESLRDDNSTDNPIHMLEKHAASVGMGSSLYHSKLFELLLREFHPFCWEPYAVREVLAGLDNNRRSAVGTATVQRLFHAVLYPDAILSEPWPKAPSFDPADFQKDPRPSPREAPGYLWDTEAHRTVAVADLPSCPEYVCISHTWGRWRTEPRTSTTVPGVPWAVPENTRFPVRDLPAQLADLGRRLARRHIWIDLFCIPQHDRALARPEIGKQASIFRGSSHCIAWLNDVLGWEGVRAALQWQCLKTTSMTSSHYRAVAEGKLPKATASASSSRAELLQDDNVNVNVWFTSLWTLQEFLLCPDVELYSRDWTPLHDPTGSPVSLRTLLLLLTETEPFCYARGAPDMDTSSYVDFQQAVTRARDYDTVFPAAVEGMWEFWASGQLFDFTNHASPTAVFAASSYRECSSKNRAPAIMSALGVTDWFRAAGEDGPSFGDYPLSFLREAAATFGGTFYDTAPTHVRPGGAGSMLPMRSLGMTCVGPRLGADYHSSVAGWALQDDGSVWLPTARVCMTTEEEPEGPSSRRGWVRCTDVASREDRVFPPEMVRGGVPDVWQTMCEQSRGAPIYAVVLYYDLSGSIDGLLLEDVTEPDDEVVVLNKIGVFHLDEGPIPPLTRVDWGVW